MAVLNVRRRLLDADDLRLVGSFLLVIAMVLITALVLGLAVRIFLLVSGLR